MLRGELLPVFQPAEVAAWTQAQENVLSEESIKQDKCGLVVVVPLQDTAYGQVAANQLLFTLEKMKNRGHDSTNAAGFTLDGQIFQAGGKGTATEAFTPDNPIPMFGMAVGHTRYGTVNESGKTELTQPVVVEVNEWKLLFAHNGNIPEKYRERVREKIPKEIRNSVNLELDSAELAWAVAAAPGNTWEEKLHAALDDIPCAFRLVMATQDPQGNEAVYALSDRTGMWPLVVGQNDEMIVMASEDTGLPEGMKARHLGPDMLVKATRDGIEEIPFYDKTHEVHCPLHEAYTIDSSAHLRPGLTAENFRRAIARQLVEQLTEEMGDIDWKNDVVIAGIPSTGLPLADEFAKAKGMTSTMILEKNPEIKKRTFIAKDEAQRRLMALQKYLVENVELLQDKILVLFDDSGIRGLTFQTVYALLKRTGIRGLHLVAGLPEFDKDCHYGFLLKQSQGLLALRRVSGELREGEEQYVRINREEMVQKITGGEEPGFPVTIHFLSEERLNHVYEETLHVGPDHICRGCRGDGKGPDALLEAALGKEVAVSVN